MGKKDNRGEAQRYMDENYKRGTRGESPVRPYVIPLTQRQMAVNNSARSAYDKGLAQLKKKR